jgi:AraC-like DNA-binding protein
LLTIEYNLENVNDVLEFLSQKFKLKREDDFLFLPENIGEGYIRIISLPNGMQCFISDYKANTDILFKRNKSHLDSFLLRVDDVHIENQEETALNKSAVLLSSIKHDWIYLVTKDTRIKALNLFFSKDWVKDFFGVEKMGEVLINYLGIKKDIFNYEPIDIEYKKLLHDILNIHSNKIFELLIIQNRVMLLIERFFTRIYNKMDNSNIQIKISTEDVNSIVFIESILVNDFTEEMPGINVLAKKAAMSPTKLKTCFKEIYGMPIYQYYQKHRMNKAKAMLLSNKYTVKEVGMEIGFTNLSNFAKAFKKAFDQLPSEVLK